MTTGEERLVDGAEQQQQQSPQRHEPLYPKRLTVHPLDWGFLVCCVFVVVGTLTVCLLIMTSATSSSSSMTADQAWPQIGDDLTKVTWAHAVNSAEKLHQALEDGTE